MSRLIVKNLPKSIKEERLRKHFGDVGFITDCSLKYTQSGEFRKFAFIGFKNEDEAQKALKKYHQTFIDASKIHVEIARDFGEVNKPRAWSKYAKENQIKKEQPQKDDKNNKSKKKSKKKDPQVVEELLGELKDDPKFNEFIDAHQNVSTKPVWTNDMLGGSSSDKSKKTKLSLEDDEEDEEEMDVSDSLDSDASEDDDEEEEEDQEEERDTVAKKKSVSDLEYLKSKVSGSQMLTDSDSDSDSEAGPKSSGSEPPVKIQAPAAESKTEEEKMYTLKMKGLPPNASEKAIKEFFQPLQLVKVRIPKSAKKKPIGVAYVGFINEKDLTQALGRNKNFIGGKRIFLKKSGADETFEPVEQKPRPWELKQNEEESEGIAETGRLFIRNLAYTCTEDDLEAVFKKYGPLTEVNMPIDPLTKKVKGFAFITFMIPEHAVKAYTDMDGKVFQGRMLHILPGKDKKEETFDEKGEGSSFKKQKKAKEKALAGSSHNWNALFLGANAVVDVLAEKYGAKKSDILDKEAKGSLGVRIALGETQVVSETREFLLTNGVSLDSFSQANAERSKTVILVKNLPAKTCVADIETVFSKHGTLGRVLLPPSGVTAIVEFVAPAEARTAFKRLAYSKFQHVPLYLEWAPMGVFISPLSEQQQPQQQQQPKEQQEQQQNNQVKKEPGVDAMAVDVKKTEEETKDSKPKKAGDEDEDDDDDDDEPGSILFVKNLNFDTKEDALKSLFAKIGGVMRASVAMKKDLKQPGKLLSLGYGFVEFRSPDGAKSAIKELQHVQLDGHSLELKISNRTVASTSGKSTGKKKQTEKKQKTTKILVRNIPFEAKKKEIEELFKVFGELKSVRLPKKLSGTGSHRGFAFVDFLTRHDAKRAFDSLCHSTHLYGRRMVLEWAEMEEDLEDIRKRTADHFHQDSGKRKFTKDNLKTSLDQTMD